MADPLHKRTGKIMREVGHGHRGGPYADEALFKEFCVGHEPEAQALVMAFREGEGQESLSEAAIGELTRRLTDSYGIPEEISRWAVKSWAMVASRTERADESGPAGSRTKKGARKKPRGDTTEAAMCVEISAMLLSAHAYDDAAECCDQALRIDPSYAWAWYNKGFALERLGRRSEAKKCYKTAKELGHLLAPSDLAYLEQKA